MDKIYTPRKTMRKFCLSCSGTAHEVRHCQVYKCELYPHRFGKRPTQEDIDTHLNSLKEN